MIESSGLYGCSRTLRDTGAVGDLVLYMNGKVMENARQFEVDVHRSTIGERVGPEVLVHLIPATDS